MFATKKDGSTKIIERLDEREREKGSKGNRLKGKTI